MTRDTDPDPQLPVLAYHIVNGLYQTLPTGVHADVARTLGWEAAQQLLDQHADLFAEAIPAPEVDVCPKCGTEGAQCCI